jgi:hypothetical protein
VSETRDIRASDAVQKWFAGAGHDTAAPEAQERYLRILADFCAYFGRSPDELLAFCYLRKKATGDRFVSVKRRAAVNESLDGFVAEQGWTGKDAVANANVVRSFLIHNGVLIQGRVWTGS